MVARSVRLGIVILLLALAWSPARADSPLIQMVNTPALGPVLADSHGMTLYWLDSEPTGTFHCTGKCLSFWPPLALSAGMAAPTVGAGVTGTFSAITRPDNGMREVTFNGYPLYTFVRDTAPGQTNGEGVKGPEGVWHAARVTAAPLTIAAAQAGASGTTSWFTVSFTSDSPGNGLVLFGSGPGCMGLVEVGMSDQHPGTTSHTVPVTGNDLPGSIGDNGIQPGVTYWFELVTATAGGMQTDNNGGKCYSVTIPASGAITASNPAPVSPAPYAGPAAAPGAPSTRTTSPSSPSSPPMSSPAPSGPSNPYPYP